VQLSVELVEELDALARKQGTSRSALIRDVLTDYVKTESDAEKDRRMIEGYTRMPQTDDVDEWGDLNAWAQHSAREMVAEEPWE
jgi:metal-responsive CopG/Arc/MetJ family transcriptional regulator